MNGGARLISTSPTAVRSYSQDLGAQSPSLPSSRLGRHLGDCEESENRDWCARPRGQVNSVQAVRRPPKTAADINSPVLSGVHRLYVVSGAGSGSARALPLSAVPAAARDRRRRLNGSLDSGSMEAGDLQAHMEMVQTTVSPEAADAESASDNTGADFRREAPGAPDPSPRHSSAPLVLSPSQSKALESNLTVGPASSPENLLLPHSSAPLVLSPSQSRALQSKLCEDCSPAFLEAMRQEQRRRSSVLSIARMARKPSIAPPESPGNVALRPDAAGAARLDGSEGKDRAGHQDKQVAAAADFPYAALWEANAVAMVDVEDDGMPPDQRACTVMHMEIAVSIDAVQHLPQADMMGKCDPYVTLSFFEQKFNTAVHRNCFEAQVCYSSVSAGLFCVSAGLFCLSAGLVM